MAEQWRGVAVIFEPFGVKAIVGPGEPPDQIPLGRGQYVNGKPLRLGKSRKAAGRAGGAPQKQRRVQRHACKAVGNHCNRRALPARRHQRNAGSELAKSVAQRPRQVRPGGKTFGYRHVMPCFTPFTKD